MENNNRDQNISNSYIEQDEEIDPVGQKGGTSQQGYNDTTDIGTEGERGETEDDTDESTVGW